MSTPVNHLAAAVAAAKDSVKDLDEPLRTEAFKIVLNKLLSDGDGEVIRPREPLATPKAERVKRDKSRKKSHVTKSSLRSDGLPSSLRLSVEELRSLKTYCERFELSGSEQIAFVLANYIREHSRLEAAGVNDIAYLYRQLVSQKVKVAAVNDIADWSRALNWLTVPSRKKEWLERVGAGYVVSNSGLLRFHEIEDRSSSSSKSKG